MSTITKITIPFYHAAMGNLFSLTNQVDPWLDKNDIVANVAFDGFVLHDKSTLTRHHASEHKKMFKYEEKRGLRCLVIKGSVRITEPAKWQAIATRDWYHEHALIKYNTKTGDYWIYCPNFKAERFDSVMLKIHRADQVIPLRQSRRVIPRSRS